MRTPLEETAFDFTWVLQPGGAETTTSWRLKRAEFDDRGGIQAAEGASYRVEVSCPTVRPAASRRYVLGGSCAPPEAAESAEPAGLATARSSALTSRAPGVESAVANRRRPSAVPSNIVWQEGCSVRLCRCLPRPRAAGISGTTHQTAHESTVNQVQVSPAGSPP